MAEGIGGNLSIIVPVYNVEQYIEQCVISLRKQDVQEIEFIIVNDGTKDSSIEICHRLIGEDKRFKIIHKKNGGLMSAWKTGVQNAHGEYIGFVDSDDWVDSNMFSLLLKAIKEYNADIVCSGYVEEHSNKQVNAGRNQLYIYEGNLIRESFIKEYCCSYFSSVSRPTICRWDKLYKKELLLNNMHYFDERISLAEDFNANIAMLLDAQRIVLLPNFTPYHYRYNPKSIVNSINPKAFQNIRALEEACDRICIEKQADTLYIDSFIGNVIYEEVKRICSRNTNPIMKNELSANLEICNAQRYLMAYEAVRKSKIVKVVCMLINQRNFSAVQFLLRIRKMIRNK